MILFKDNVRFKKLTPELKHIIDVLYDLNEQRIPNYPEDWIVTSINDSEHKIDSKHYKNKALDLRSKNFSSSNIKHEFKHMLSFKLEDKFTVLLESEGLDNEHFHIQ